MLPVLDDAKMAQRIFAFLNQCNIPAKEKIEAIAMNSPDVDELLLGTDLIDEENLEMVQARIDGVLQLRANLSADDIAWIKKAVAPIREHFLIQEMINKLDTPLNKAATENTLSTGIRKRSYPFVDSGSIRRSWDR